MGHRIRNLPDSVELLTHLPIDNLPNVDRKGNASNLIWNHLGNSEFVRGFSLRIAAGVVQVLEGTVKVAGNSSNKQNPIQIKGSSVVHFVPNLETGFVRVNLWVI